jgi:hypothetical protein
MALGKEFRTFKPKIDFGVNYQITHITRGGGGEQGSVNFKKYTRTPHHARTIRLQMKQLRDSFILFFFTI